MALRLSVVCDLFAGELSVLRKGEKHLESNDIVAFRIEENLCKAKVMASMKKLSYDVEITLESKDNVASFSCTCPAGQYRCSHVACVLLHLAKNVSSTDVTCMWKQPPKAKMCAAVDDIFEKETFQAFDDSVAEAAQKFLLTSLSENEVDCNLSWLCHPENEDEDDVNDMSKFFVSNILCQLHDIHLLPSQLHVTPRDIESIEIATRGQRDNPLWIALRQGRLTASNFGLILSAVSRNSFPPSLFSTLHGTDSSKLAGVKAVQWGIQNECDAILEYSEHYGTSVTPNGLFLDECGFLGATPDGVIDSETILEIKCPFKARNKSLEDLAKNDKSFFLGFDDNYFLKLNHPYYHQIQGQLYICHKQVCHLYVWSPSCSINIEIKRDMQWSGNMDILKKFYLDNLSQIVNVQ